MSDQHAASAAYAELKGAQQEQIRNLAKISDEQQKWHIKQDDKIIDIDKRLSLVEQMEPQKVRDRINLIEQKVVIYGTLAGTGASILFTLALKFWG